MSEFVDELNEKSEGFFLITTQGSMHLWCLGNEGGDWYIRMPQDHSKGRGFHPGFNNTRQFISKMHNWPKVDEVFLVSVNNSVNPWHKSSGIKSIERLDMERAMSIIGANDVS